MSSKTVDVSVDIIAAMPGPSGGDVASLLKEPTPEAREKLQKSVRHYISSRGFTPKKGWTVSSRGFKAGTGMQSWSKVSERRWVNHIP